MSSKAFSVMLLTLMLAATSNAGTLRPGGKTAIKDRYIVVLKDVAPGDVRGVAEAIGRAQNSTTFSPMRGAIRAFGIIMNEHRARALTHHPLVDYIEQDEWLSVASEKTAFDFREDGTAAKAGKAPATAEKSFRPWTTALTSCPWNGSYYHCSYADDTYWALDRLDQTGPLHSVPRGYGYTTGGTNVRAYMVGFGVHAAHSEFDSRVLAGYNMMADPEVIHAGGHPGEETDVTSTDSTPANNPCGMWPGRDANTAHDTAAASVLGGNTTGVAKDVLIVPVKVIQCLNSNDYRLSKLALARGLDLIYNDVTGLRWQFGAAVPAVAVIAPYWHGTSADLGNECECVGPQGGTCTWDPNTSKYWKNCVSMIEEEINSLASIRIASVVPATNHSDDTCSRIPGRMGQGGSYPTTYRTITVGATMYHGPYPWGTQDDRWTCAAQPGGCDSWGGANPGSSFGPCVSIWAPGWNLRVAGGAGPSSYRSGYGASSGTSWAAPYVAGVIARLLQSNPYWTVSDVWTRLVSDAALRTATPDFDPSSTHYNNKLVYIAPTQ